MWIRSERCPGMKSFTSGPGRQCTGRSPHGKGASSVAVSDVRRRNRRASRWCPEQLGVGCPLGVTPRLRPGPLLPHLRYPPREARTLVAHNAPIDNFSPSGEIETTRPFGRPFDNPFRSVLSSRLSPTREASKNGKDRRGVWKSWQILCSTVPRALSVDGYHATRPRVS